MSHYDVIIIIIVIIIHYMFVHFLQFRLVYNCNVLIIRVVLLSLSYWVAGLRWDGIDYQELVLEPIYFLNFSLNNTIELKTCPVYCRITTKGTVRSMTPMTSPRSSLMKRMIGECILKLITQIK